MLKCQEATRLYSEAQERHLTFTERASLKFHVMICRGCKNFGRQMLDLGRFARGYAQGENESDTVRAGAGDESPTNQD